MTGDALRNRLAAANPVAPSQPVDPIEGDRARTLMEDIMSTTTTRPAADRRRLALVGAAALVAVFGGAALFGSLDAENTPPLVLTAEGGDVLASCMPFDVATLSEMSPAFAGTVVEVTDSTATLEVDRWFAGEQADTVQIRYTHGFEALIGTPTLEVGQRYLITAAEGTVNGCGYSGPATPEYEAAFEEAFGS